jgi:murein DD-endopeptidase MepM/ murein hydrolase activator NlpD
MSKKSNDIGIALSAVGVLGLAGVAAATRVKRKQTALDPGAPRSLELGRTPRQTEPATQSPPQFAAVYPLPLLPDGRKPRITSHHKARNPSRPTHDGADFFFATMPGDPAWKVGDGGGTTNKKWIVPPGTPAIAVAAGVVQLAGDTPTGWRVWIDHGALRTGYFHLTELFVDKGQRVTTGQQLGLVGDNPRDHDARHLHFELSASDRYAPIDPAPYLARAVYMPLKDTQGPIRHISGIVARKKGNNA